MSMFKSKPELCDVVSLVIYSNTDVTLMLIADNNEHWIPSVKVPGGQSWDKAISKEIQEILGAQAPDKILKLTKFWIPRHSKEYLLHCAFQMIVDPGAKNKAKNTMGKYRGKIRWVTEAELTKLCSTDGLKSPELIEYFHLVKSGSSNVYYVQPEEFTIRENVSETNDSILVTGKSNIYQQLVEASGIDKLAQESLVQDFLLLCFPACYMSYRAFAKFIPEIGWSKDTSQYLFRSADLNNRNGLSFREFLYFLAAVDPNTVHGGPAAEIRCRYMFKYYDRDKDNLLKLEEIKNVLIDLRKSKNQPTDPANVGKEASDTFKAMGVKETAGINVMEFLKAVCDLKIRGTSSIYRSPTGILKYLKESSGPVGDLPSQTANIGNKGASDKAVSLTTLKQPVNEQNRRISMDIFSQRSISNELLKGLRYLTSINKTKDPKAVYTWGQLDPNTYGRNLIAVCSQVKDILKTESRLLELNSPMYIMGDLHGNVADLLYFERVLWHIGPGLSPCNLLFLGDYVDRGAYSIEVISYLFAYKQMHPGKVNLLRGNHEIREVQKMFTFFKECVLKLGDKLGNEVWMAVNNAFDTMPIAAVIDGKLFCCHGGAPPPWLCPTISAINDIPVPLNQPDTQSSLAWELMWNDPVRLKTVNDKLQMELLANEGFAVNSRRGTAHIFSVEALERFLKANQLTHLVRAHEVAQAGFHVQQKGKLLTVFSSSKYCGGQNDAACVMADQGKLRILRLETD